MVSLVDLNVEHICKALRELSVVIDFISNGKADILQDGEAWDMRMNGGLQVFRLHTMISPDQLALTAIDGYKLELLQNAWRSVASLQHGAHLDELNVHHCSVDEYRGPLFLPGEVGPNGQFRKFDEVVDTWLDLFPDLDDGLLHTYLEMRPKNFSETKQEMGECVASELKEYADRLDQFESPELKEEPCIPAEHRTKMMTKKDAAKILGRPNPDSGVKWLNACIDDGIIRCEKINRQTFVFDKRNFPKEAQAKLN